MTVNTARISEAQRAPKPSISARPPSTSTAIAMAAPTSGSGRPLEAMCTGTGESTDFDRPAGRNSTANMMRPIRVRGLCILFMGFTFVVCRFALVGNCDARLRMGILLQLVNHRNREVDPGDGAPTPLLSASS